MLMKKQKGQDPYSFKMKKEKIKQNYKKLEKYDFEIRDIFRRYLNREVSFGIVLNRLLLRKIIYIET